MHQPYNSVQPVKRAMEVSAQVGQAINRQYADAPIKAGRPPGDIVHAGAHLNASVSELEVELKELEQALAPAIGNGRPDGDMTHRPELATSNGGPQAAPSPLAADINSYARRIVEAAALLRSLRNNLQL